MHRELLFEHRGKDLVHEILAMNWSQSWLPEVTESTVMSTKISSFGAEATGLLEGTPVAAGGGIALLRQSGVRLWRRVKFR